MVSNKINILETTSIGNKKDTFVYSKTKSNNFDNRENDVEKSREIVVKLYYFFLIS